MQSRRRRLFLFPFFDVDVDVEDGDEGKEGSVCWIGLGVKEGFFFFCGREEKELMD